MGPSQLLLQPLRLTPGAEWPLPATGWTFARIRSGEGYLLGRNSATECTPGCVAVSGGGQPVELRASQLGPVELDWFRLDPASLFGVLTLFERRRVDHPADMSPVLPWVLPPGSPASVRFAEAVTAGATRPLEQRGRLLEVVAAALSPEPFRSTTPEGYQRDAGDRLEELLHQLTDAELLALSADQLAEMCRCEKRRLLLLFRERFGGSLPGQQGEWMRLKACSLLAQPGASITSVARACGYEEPDAFRAWFRRQFGKAPAKWRRDTLGRNDLRTEGETAASE